MTVSELVGRRWSDPVLEDLATDVGHDIEEGCLDGGTSVAKLEAHLIEFHQPDAEALKALRRIL